ncbi:Glycerol-3-phosphate 1-O-acyltransferase [Roseovarius sp. EC-HK134]|jgi:glycerol-3-phosphate O-acyltransferase|uniref:Glycerol-3-phosphate acyltransferase n=1 Tax=Roseovarius mucosus TaxID=215743 RepID=A0A1V0RNE5_9RHOB|nr:MULTISPECIES: 1-acyl-sn-glycerol-3-phosphate acyltransferase [Roseovarius]ARE83310.1 putative acyltransferase plsB1 [Roseovarius mucosus]AWZ20064.1 Acyltransferase family protein associated with ethylmalonyl-CoA pathway [Roseovarius sp. AK1035]EDM31580.1 acyltransferase family protein [Roseovarius sp. TM1035]VVT12062.1 Glycerol-3-phosphate 1-O-acyltransferase [Roseovarius sp. EC-HK134]VVT12179.1 Glycerol-3-phosphate 1-O-acyltransferase [Roseovarius sp. EC-SD190]
MGQTVDMPLWALVLLVGFAAVTFASHFLFPSVRWFLRRRLERAVARLNTRLQRPIEPFKLARRYDMIQRLIYDPEVSRAIAAHAQAEGIPENVAFEQAKRYAREIVPSFSATAYFGIAIKLAKWLSRSLYRVRLGHFDEEALAAVDREATVVFVMNHRSNMDYVLVTWLAAERSALSYAVGEWARVWPLSRLIKAMGAYFIRRKSRGDLYRRVLARYVGMATDGGVTQAMFPEGGLSLTGGLQPPKLGLLKYMVEERSPDGRDVVFVPVAINYDRVFEDRLLVAAAEAGGRRFPARISVVAGFVLRQVWLRLRRRYHRHGYAAVSFGAPMSLAEFERDHPEAGLRGLARALMARIGAEVPVLPVPLVARALMQAEGPLTRDALDAAVAEMLGAVPRAHVHLPRKDLGYAARFGIQVLRERGMIEERQGAFVITEAERPVVAYYAASIDHLFCGRSRG